MTRTNGYESIWGLLKQQRAVVAPHASHFDAARAYLMQATVPELRKIAATERIEGRSKMKRDALVEALVRLVDRSQQAEVIVQKLEQEQGL